MKFQKQDWKNMNNFENVNNFWKSERNSLTEIIFENYKFNQKKKKKKKKEREKINIKTKTNPKTWKIKNRFRNVLEGSQNR